MREKLRALWAKAKVLVGAAPARAAVAVAVLTVVQAEVVPHLPVGWQMKVGATCATLILALGAVVRAVSAVTPVPAAERGLLPPS